jgi:hypothetical protein
MRKHLAIGAAALSALGVSLVNAGAARADFLPSAVPPTVTATGTGTYLYSYEVFVTNAQDAVAGNFFTLVDFNGLVAVRSAPAGWTSSVSATTPPVTIPGIGTITPNDSPFIPDVTFTYGGPPILGGPVSLGIFQLESLYPAGLLRPFIGNGNDKLTGVPNANITNYVAPVPEPGEYAAMGVFGLGLAGLLVRARRKANGAGMAAAA